MKVQIQTSAGPKDAERVEIETRDETTSTFRLADGSEIRMRVAVTDILRVDGEYDGEGNPVYIVKSQNVVSVFSPENLRRPIQ